MNICKEERGMKMLRENVKCFEKKMREIFAHPYRAKRYLRFDRKYLLDTNFSKRKADFVQLTLPELKNDVLLQN